MLSAMKCEVYEIEEILDKFQTKKTVVIQLFNLFIKNRTKNQKYGAIQQLRGQDEGGRGLKNVDFCPRSGYENCPLREGGGGKKWQNSVHIVE